MENKMTDRSVTRPKAGVLAFAQQLAQLTDAKMTGVFLENQDGSLVMVMRDLQGASGSHSQGSKPSPAKQSCGPGQETDSHTPYVQLDEVISESRFSDLLILDAQMSFDDNQQVVVSAFTKGVLTKTECPVVIVPFSFDRIEEIIFAYDGTPSAVFAIKQFAHLFPSLNDIKLTVLQVNNTEGKPIKERDKILSLLQTHYSSIGFHTITGVAKDELYKY
ncbi:MAG: hypothetical protein ABI813_05295, partial [Bacteroidota bacterium]